MVQLEIEGVFVDLYEQDPIKLNFNIEDIVDVAIQSEYSRQFRVPATDHNYDVFKTLFDVEGFDFDVTQKREASILIDGAEFRRGEVRLLNIYRSDSENKIDYEIVFLGSTKNLGSKLGNKTISQLDMTAYEHEITYTNIRDSWEAFPEGGLTDGLFDGDIIYPLVDFGNTYDSNGVPEQTRVALGDGTGIHMNNSSWPLTVERFRPMMRAKAILDMIFEEAGYTYTSNFFNSTEFKQIYMSGWGNDTIVDTNINNLNLATFGFVDNEVWQFGPTTNVVGGPFINVPMQNIIYDWGDNLTATTVGGLQTYSYETPVNGNYSFDIGININFSTRSSATIFTLYAYQYDDGSAFAFPITYTFDLINGGLQCEITRSEFGQPDTVDTVDVIFTFDPTFGPEYRWSYSIFEQLDINTAFWPQPAVISGPQIQVTNGLDAIAEFYGTYINVTEAAGGFIPTFSFGNEYKQLDFLKDLFTMFRLVLVPDVNDPSNFIIEPWTFYIGSGQIKDWTNKIDRNKDKVIKPIVLEQEDRIYYKMAEDKDWLNALNLDEFKEPFGTQIVNSGYEILDGEKTYEIKIAPTPFTQIQGYTINTSQWEKVIIPQICTQEATDNGVQFKPIAAKERLLYYNGKQLSGTWYFKDDSDVVQSQLQVPIVSYYSQWPPNPNAKILNFQRENGYDQEGVYNVNYGQDLYTRYWSTYNSTIYDKWARRLTAYFTLDITDILNFDYKDVIYLEGAYYYVERIYNAPLDSKSLVKVDLVKINNYLANVGGFIPPIELNIWGEFDEVWGTTTAGWDD